MTELLKKSVALSLAAVMMAFCLPASAFADASSTSDGTVCVCPSLTYVNPLYADVIDESDLVQPSSSTGLSPMGTYSSDIANSVSEAAQSVREDMVSREQTITVHVVWARDQIDNSMYHTIFDAALAHTKVGSEGDYLEWQYGGWSASAFYKNLGFSSNVDLCITYTMTYYTTAEQESAVTSTLATAKDTIESTYGISASSSTYEKVLAIYKYITSTVTYDNANLNDDSYKLKYTAYAALINHTSVCQGYSNLFYRMCLDYYGIDCRMVPSSSDECHIWNIVQVGEKYYDVDATWDAGRKTFIWFLKCDATFTAKGNHTRATTENNSTVKTSYASEEFYAAYPMSDVDFSVCSTHTPVTDAAVAATCTTDGLSAGSRCSVCGKVLVAQEVVKAFGHDFSVLVSPTVTATCTSVGTTALYKCSRCDATTGGKAVPATGHHYVSEVTTAATCKAPGVTTYTCDRCGDTYTETIPQLAHVVVIDSAVDATCTTDGLSTGSHCSTCGAVIAAQQTVPALRHTYLLSATLPASWEQAGSYHYVCSRCGDAYETPIAAVTKVALSASSFTYTGRAIKPTVEVADANGKALSEGTDYTLSYAANTAVGTAKVTVTFMGTYTGSIARSFKIAAPSVGKANLKKLTAKKRSLVARWGKVTGATGYRIVIAKNKAFTKGVKYFTIGKANTLTKKIKGLAKGKKRYVKVQAYRVVGGKVFYGSWSKAKARAAK